MIMQSKENRDKLREALEVFSGVESFAPVIKLITELLDISDHHVDHKSENAKFYDDLTELLIAGGVTNIPDVVNHIERRKGDEPLIEQFINYLKASHELRLEKARLDFMIKHYAFICRSGEYYFLAKYNRDGSLFHMSECFVNPKAAIDYAILKDSQHEHAK